MIYGICAAGQEASFIPPGSSAAVRFDNTSTSNGIVKTATIADSPLLTVSMWFKIVDVSAEQNQIVAFDDFNTYFSVTTFAVGDVLGSFLGAGGKYLQFGSAGGAAASGVYNHLFSSVDTNHGAASKLYNLLLNGADIIDGDITQDIDTAFDIPFNGKNFGIPAANDFLGISGVVSIAEAWIAPGVYLDASDVTLFRDIGGNPVALGDNGETPTGTPPAYYFRGDATTFATNLGSGGAVTLVGSMDSVTGPP